MLPSFATLNQLTDEHEVYKLKEAGFASFQPTDRLACGLQAQVSRSSGFAGSSLVGTPTLACRQAFGT